MNPLLRFIIIFFSAIVVFVGVGLLGTYVYNMAYVSPNAAMIAPKHQKHNTFQDSGVYLDDAIRYILANAHPEYAYFDFENPELSSKTENMIEDIAGKIDDFSQPRYKIALTQLSTSGTPYEKKYSSRLLQLYNELEINITSVQQDEQYDFVYHFIEGNSHVHFTAGLSFLSYCTPDIWDLRRYTEYLETGTFEEAPTGEDLNEDEKDPWLLSFWRQIMKDEFREQDEQYLKKKYPSGVATHAIVLVGEYIDDEDKEEIIPNEDVIMAMVEHHYSDSNYYEFPTPKLVGEFYVKAYERDYYKILNLKDLCNAYQLCQSLILTDEFNTFLHDLKEPDYPFIDINTIKSAKTQQEKDICRVLNAWLYAAFGNGGLDPTTKIFGEYF